MKTILSSLATVSHPRLAQHPPPRVARWQRHPPWIRVSARAYAFAGWFLSQTDHGVW